MNAIFVALTLCMPAQTPTDGSAPVPPAGQALGASPGGERAGIGVAGDIVSAEPEADGELVTVVDLITIGSGDHLWTSFGHTAISVMRMNPETKEFKSTVYNWGDADFGGFAFMWSFFTGHAVFRLTNMGTIEDVVNQYATLDRTLVQQRFALTPKQADLVAARLEHHAQPENRDYIYHHMNATCATKVRDFFDDEILDGTIKKQLTGVPDRMSPRYYGRKYFAGFFFAELFNDLFMGRLHDDPWDRYTSLTVPDNLAAYLQEVQVPDPKGGDVAVPLLTPPTPIVRDVADKPYRGEGRSLIHVTYLLLAVIIAMGVYSLRRKRVVLEDAGFWLFLGALPSSAIAVCMIFGAVFSTVIEGRVNELHLVYPVTDLVLLPVAFLWWRGRAYFPKWLWLYGWARLGGILLSLLLHAAGVFYQEPRVMVVAGLCGTVMFLLILYRLRQAEVMPVIHATKEKSASVDAA